MEGSRGNPPVGSVGRGLKERCAACPHSGSTWGSFLSRCAQEPPLQCQESPSLRLHRLSRPLEARPLLAKCLQDLSWGCLPRELAHRLFSVGKGDTVGSLLGNYQGVLAEDT